MSLIGYARVSTSEGKQLLDRKHPTIPSTTILKNTR
jgi:predicted site-specific integrase-resolvase